MLHIYTEHTYNYINTLPQPMGVNIRRNDIFFTDINILSPLLYALLKYLF